MTKFLRAKEVAEKLNFSLHYFRESIASTPDFPKPIRMKNDRGGFTQPRWAEDEIAKYLQRCSN